MLGSGAAGTLQADPVELCFAAGPALVVRSRAATSATLLLPPAFVPARLMGDYRTDLPFQPFPMPLSVLSTRRSARSRH